MFSTTLPTDNLYKFMAIAGVSVGLLSLYLMFSRMEQGWDRTAILERESSGLIEEEQQNRLALEKLKDKTGTKAKALEDAQNDIKKRKTQIYQDLKASMRFVEDSLFLVGQLKIVSAIGFIVAVCGFYLWYWKVQRHLDIAIKKQIITAG